MKTYIDEQKDLILEYVSLGLEIVGTDNPEPEKMSEIREKLQMTHGEIVTASENLIR